MERVSFASGREWGRGHSLEVVAVVVVVVAVVAAAGSSWQPQQLLWLGWMVRGENMIYHLSNFDKYR